MSKIVYGIPFQEAVEIKKKQYGNKFTTFGIKSEILLKNSSHKIELAKEFMKDECIKVF